MSAAAWTDGRIARTPIAASTSPVRVLAATVARHLPTVLPRARQELAH
jgi:hypothetical protein